MRSERNKLILTGILLANLVVMFLPWFGKGALKILGIELMVGPLTLLGGLGVMLGLWWFPRHRLAACLTGTLLILAEELHAFFFWPNLTSVLPDPGFSLRFTYAGFYVGLGMTLILLAGCLLCGWRALAHGQAQEKN